MIDIVRRDIIAVLFEFLEILREKDDVDISQVRKISNHTIHNASVFQDEDSVSVAVLIYSLSKLMERNSLDYSKISSMLKSGLEQIKSNNEEGFRKGIRNIFKYIRSVDNKLKLYIYEVINQAQIKKGCKMCEHGLSVARAAEIMGISQWELMHYLGKTTFLDRISEPVSVYSRMKIARNLFS